MNLDPFGDPFKVGLSLSTADIFKKPRTGGGVRAPKKAEAAEEPEPEPLASDAGSEEAAKEETKPADKVTLSNPKWEVEDVGFNEETDISVEAVLPESQAHKTKVDFELFAKTPDGEERISQAEGNIAEGKAVARIPVYIPQYKDGEGNLLKEVEYYFSAKHSASDLFKDDTVVKRVNEMANLLIECHILEDVTFATAKSQVRTTQAPKLKALTERIAKWKEEHPEGKIAVFGHADAEGKEDPNKKLSERRAKSIHAFLMKDAVAWDALAKEEKWDKKPTPDFQAFMDGNNALTLADKAFEAIDGKPFMGCSEFNQVEAKQGAHEPNRRVSVFLLKSSKNFPIQYPCAHGDIAPCRKQVARKGDRRTPGFGCLFYDKLVTETKVGPGALGTVKLVGINEAEIKQYVNMEPEEGKPEQGKDRKIEVEVVDGLGDGDEVFWTIKPGGKNSPRTDPKRGPKLLIEDEPAEFKEGVAHLVSIVEGGKSHILLACGVGGGDEFNVEVAGSRDKVDCKVKIVTWRRLEYETIHPKAKGDDRLTDWTVFTPDKGPGLPPGTAAYLDRSLGKGFVEFKELHKDAIELKDLPDTGKYNVLDAKYAGRAAGTKFLVATPDQLETILDVKSKHRANKRTVAMIWCDYLAEPTMWDEIFLEVYKEQSRSPQDSVFEHAVGPSALVTHGKYAVRSLRWSVTHWFDASAPEGSKWKSVANAADPGYAHRAGGNFTDEADIKAHLQFDTLDRVTFKFPDTKADYPGKKLTKDGDGQFTDKGKVLGLSIRVLGAASVTNFNGMAINGKIWMNSFAGRVDQVGMGGVIAHELGHNMGQAYGNKDADKTFGRPNDKPMPGIPFPKPVPDGDVYGGKGHQGTHCAKGLTNKGEADYTVRGSKAFKEHTCVMFGASDMEDSKEFHFCEDCIRYIRAEDLKDIHRSWRS